MSELWSLVDAEMLARGLRAALIAIVGLLVSRLGASAVHRVARNFTTAHVAMLSRRAALYGLVLLTVAWTLSELGFDLSVVLGVAGVATVAVGFAAQTSMSNLISGLFLVFERPFVAGDMIDVGGRVGEVLSIDAMSLKLRTFDNLYVRIPNETLLKSEVTNLTRFPIRRVDLRFGLSHVADHAEVRRQLIAAMSDLPEALREPAPIMMVTSLEEAGVAVQLSVWGRTSDFVALRTAAVLATRRLLTERGVSLWQARRQIELIGSGTASAQPVPEQGREGARGEHASDVDRDGPGAGLRQER